MASFDKNDYTNALSALTQCQAWVKDNLKDVIDTPNFKGIKALCNMGIDDRFYQRGMRTKDLCINGRGEFYVRGLCSDGYITRNDIHYSEKPYTYAYNSSAEMTIKVALIIIKHWETIKQKILQEKDRQSDEKVKNSFLLASFKV